MKPLRRPGPAVPLAGLLLLGPSSPAQDPPPPSPAPEASPASAQPIRDSIERVVERMERQREDPCALAIAEGRPCFPVTTVIVGPTYSVREGLREALSSPVPPRPAGGELGPYRPGTRSTVVPLVSFDPGCVGKSLFKKLKGRNDTYYIYRLRDALGERVEMFDRKLEAERFQGDLEQLGKFDGECEAVAAYRQFQLRYAPASPGPSPLPSPTVAPGSPR